MSEPVIKINNLSKFFQSKAIVTRMNLEVPRGALFGLLGPNGAGKSTTLKLLTGNLKPTSGNISIMGLNPWKDRVELFRKVGYLPQNPSLHRDKTVYQFLRYMARLKGFSRSESKYAVRDILDQVGLSKFEQSIVGKLSGGETQRLGFANTLIGDPEILILDEPTASLDPEGRIYVMGLITDLAKDKNRTIIISSHILPEIQRMTNHIAIMSEGKVLVSGKMRELTQNVFDDTYEIHVSHPEDLKTKLDDLGYLTNLDLDVLVVNANGKLLELWKDIPRICSENNYQLKSYKPVKDALENLFIKLVSKNTSLDSIRGEQEELL
ncbi:MAG: ABC transporter ATP-binding protein [Candidatus Heimdallarchaeota archaeon]|nr:ABC transporter ATP-binding protein [Candidatus Heimdallarchaeota archaeon]